MIGTMARGEADVLAYMRQSGGVITRREALALGMSSTTLKTRVSTGHLIAVGFGIYTLPGVLESELTLLRAATAALDAVASHQSAGRLHGLDGLGATRVAVSVPVRRSNRFAGVVVHQLTDLSVDEVVEISGIPATDPSRTIIDLAAILSVERLAPIADQAVRMKLTSYSKLLARLDQMARRGKPGVTTMRRLLEPRLGRNYASDSALETKLLNLLEKGGLPRPDTQYRPPWLRKMNGRVDLAYVQERVIVEGDSRQWHGAPEPFQADRRRDNLAQLAGWIVLRFTWDDITNRPVYVVQTVRDALSARRRDRIQTLEH